MGLFSKKEKIKEKESTIPNLPKLPELPRLPDNFDEENFNLPSIPDSDDYLKEIHGLPSFPTNNFGEKFSQNTIKNAVSGREDNEYEEEIQEEKIIPEKIQYRLEKKDEPVFIRIDKFEDALKIFSETKNKISEIENLLKEIKQIKEKEENELNFWEKEIREMKIQIEKIDKDIFSKI